MTEVITPLNLTESKRLAELESQIETARLTVSENYRTIGTVLTEIRDSKLYRENHSTFEEYVKTKWQIGKSRAYQLIDAAATAAICPPLVDIPTERAARELSGLTEKQKKAVLNKLKIKSEMVDVEPVKLTASKIKKAVNKAIKKIKPEAPGKPLPRGGLAATREPEETPEADPAMERAAQKVEAWYAEHRQRLNEYPMATPDGVVKQILALLRK